MKKVFLTLLAMIVIIGALVGAGYWGYRIGYVDSATSSGPFFGRSYHMDPNQMPFHMFEEGFGQRPMLRPGSHHGYGIGYGFFSPFRTLWNVAILALIIGFVYWLFTKSGWQITRKIDAAPKTDSDDPPGN